MQAFTSVWWDRLVEAWNRSDHTRALAGLGTVEFHVTDTPLPPVWINWNGTGQAQRLQRPARGAVRFSATAADWHAFIDGEFTATMGVLRGRLIYEGALTRVLPYSQAFNLLSKVAQSLRARQT